MLTPCDFVNTAFMSKEPSAVDPLACDPTDSTFEFPTSSLTPMPNDPVINITTQIENNFQEYLQFLNHPFFGPRLKSTLNEQQLKAMDTTSLKKILENAGIPSQISGKQNIIDKILAESEQDGNYIQTDPSTWSDAHVHYICKKLNFGLQTNRQRREACIRTFCKLSKY